MHLVHLQSDLREEEFKMQKKRRKEWMLLLLTIVYQIAFTIQYLVVTKGNVTYPKWKKVDKILYYSNKSYAVTKLLLAAVAMVILIETIIVCYGIYKKAYTGVFSVAIGMLLFYGVILQSFFNKGNNLRRHMEFMAVGFLLMWLYYWFVRKKLSEKQIKMLAKMIALFLIISMAAVIFSIITKQSVNGAYGWINVDGMSVQPGEFMKVLMILFSSCCMQIEMKKKMKLEYLGLNLLAIITLVVSRDLGNASVLLANALVSSYFLFYDSYKKAFFGVSAALIAGGTVVGSLMSHVRSRFTECFHALENPGSQQYTSLMAIVKGGLRGLGADGNVTDATGIFAASTDLAANSLFAIFGGVTFLLIVVVLALLFANIFITPDLAPFQSMQAVLGITTIFVQAVLHIGGGLNILPLTGICLPFVSAGGSNMLASFMIVGGIMAGLVPEFIKQNQRGI